MVSLDRVFDLLSDERRRYALYYLEKQDGPVSIDELAEQVAEWETNPGRASVPEEKFEEIELRFIHRDLPKASEAGYVKYDPEEGEIALVDEPREFDAIVSIAEVIERPDRYP